MQPAAEPSASPASSRVVPPLWDANAALWNHPSLTLSLGVGHVEGDDETTRQQEEHVLKILRTVASRDVGLYSPCLHTLIHGLTACACSHS